MIVRSGFEEDFARQVMNAFQVTPREVGLDGEIVRSHRERRPGWRGAIDWLLRRRPVLVIDEFRLTGVAR